MEVIFEILFQIGFEFVLEIIAQVLVELGFASLAEPLRNKAERNPILVSIGYILFGFILGGLSLLIFPEPIIKGNIIKLVNFVVSPILIGVCLCISSWIMRGRKGQIFEIDKFVFGVLFAISYSLVRFLFTT